LTNLITPLVWLALPVLIAGVAHLFVLKADSWPALRRLPLDAGLHWRGRRIFGANKTWRGAAVMIGTTTLASIVLESFNDCCLQISALPDFAQSHPGIWGLLLGVGYIVGELPNSFTKRQLGIPPGAAGQGATGRFFWYVDQLDSLVGMLLFTMPVWQPPWSLVVLLFALMLMAHPVSAWVMVQFGLKTRVG
jgi:hypothetical protein